MRVLVRAGTVVLLVALAGCGGGNGSNWTTAPSGGTPGVEVTVAVDAAADWYFMGGSKERNPVPGRMIDTIVANNRNAGVRSVVTIPTGPYVNATSTRTCSFPVSIYGPQQKVNPDDHPNGDDCGNGLRPDGSRIDNSDPLRNHVRNSPDLARGLVRHRRRPRRLRPRECRPRELLAFAGLERGRDHLLGPRLPALPQLRRRAHDRGREQVLGRRHGEDVDRGLPGQRPRDRVAAQRAEPGPDREGGGRAAVERGRERDPAEVVGDDARLRR